MRISDWSSDVCSSDLRSQAGFVEVEEGAVQRQNSGIIAHGRDHRGKKPDSTLWPQRHARVETQLGRRNRDASGHEVLLGGDASDGRRLKIGRASCRERVCKYV